MAVWVGTSLKIFGGVAVVWMSTVPTYANPVGEQVVAGAATFQRVGNSLTIQQGTDRAVFNWSQFSIGAGETTKFVMPSASSAALNRVLSGNPSAIYGSLQANGQLFLINPAGILVGPGGTINAASFIASTHDISNEAFMRGGDLGFLGDSAASILNQGRIEASSGDVLLIAQHVENEGQLVARDGTAGMVSGTQVSLQSVGPQHFKVRLVDVPDETGVKRDQDGVADIVNEGVIEAANAVLEATGNVGSLAINNRGTVRATGVRPNADGSVTLTGGEGDVLNSGLVAALRKNIEGKETGGEIRIAGRNVTTEETSIVSAAGAAGGGKIRMRATDTTLISGRVEATGYGDQANGGQVEMLGQNVGLRSGEVNADGGAKGGTVLVGGDYLGLNPDVPNAKATVITPDARISANATVSGDGGKVIVWSDEYTGFFGSITALGGPEGGNGGFIETSSKNNLQAFGEAQASAAKGLPGEWLLDPYNVSIVDQAPTSGGGFNGQNPDIFSPTSNDAKIYNQDINRALDAGTSVTITTGSSTTTGGNGDILVRADIRKTKETPVDAPDVIFSLQAANDIIVFDGVTIGSTEVIPGIATLGHGKLGIQLLADYDQQNGGVVQIGEFVELNSNGGNIIIRTQATGQSGRTFSIAQTALLNPTTPDHTGGATFYNGQLVDAWGGQRFSGDVTIGPSVTGTTVGVGGGTGTLQITQDMVNTVRLLDPGAVTTAQVGTLWLGSETSGTLRLGTLDAPNGLPAYVRLVSGYTITGNQYLGILQDGGAGLNSYGGMAILDSRGTIGDSLNPVLVNTKQLGVITQGTGISIQSSQFLNRLYVQSAGLATTQSITDGGNLNYDVYENALTTFIGNAGGSSTYVPVAGGTGGLYVNTGSIDFTYMNTAGGITVGAAGLSATPTGWNKGIPFGILAVQDPNGSSGLWTGAPGKVTLKANGVLNVTTTLPNGDPAAAPYPTGTVVPGVLALSGGVFTGGGDLAVEATDLLLGPEDYFNPDYIFYYATGPTRNTGYDGQILGPQFGAALNTFYPSVSPAAPGAYDFGSRLPVLGFTSASGQISGAGGALKITTPATIYGPTPIVLADSGNFSGSMAIRNTETWSMEANNIQIGGQDSGSLALTRHNVNYGVIITVLQRDSSTSTSYFYPIRYFENPLNSYALGGDNDFVVPSTSNLPVPRVANGVVSLVSGTGDIKMEVGGDINVNTLNVTAINGVDLQGNNGGEVGNYAGSGTANRFLSVGSIINNLTGRLGRTVLNTRVSQGQSFNAIFAVNGVAITDNPSGLYLGDSTGAVRAVALMEPDGTGALRVSTITIDQASLNQAGAGLGDFSGPIQVIIGEPDLPGGRTATATATLGSTTAVTVAAPFSSAGRVINITLTDAGTGYLKPPSITVVVPKNPGADSGLGGQQAAATLTLDTAAGGKVTAVTPKVTIGGTDYLFGGAGYEAVPAANLVGGGITPGAARAVINEYGQVGAIAAVQNGLGYSTESPPVVTISGGGGTGARATAVINNLGQLSPYNVNLALGDQAPVFTTTPTIEIIPTDGKGSGAVARPVLQGKSGQQMSLVGVMPVDPGEGYTPGSTVIVRVTGGAIGTIPTGLVTARVNPDGRLGSFTITDYGSGYTSEPTVTLTGGGIGVAQVRPYVDRNPLSGNFGRVTAYQIADPGLGYKTAPTAIVGVGGPNGQTGEVGVSTDVVDRNIGSGTITIYNSQVGTTTEQIQQDLQSRSILVNAPVITGGAKGSDGGASLTGSVLLAASGDIIANLNSTLFNQNSYAPAAYRGLIGTGDAFLPEGDQSVDVLLSGSIRLFGLSISSALQSPFTTANISQGVPVQVGIAPGGYSGGLQATTFGTRPKGGEEGALRIYAPAPGEFEQFVGQPLNPNLAAPAKPRTSNDLKLLGLNTADGVLNRVRVEVGAVEGLLSLETFEPSGATAQLTAGSVTSILPGDTGNVYLDAPTVLLDGLTVRAAAANAVLANGAVDQILIANAGEGYSNAPVIQITSVDGNGSGATAVATIQDGKVVGVTITNRGFGYTQTPLVTIAAPAGTQATAALGSLTTNSGIQSILPTTAGAGYLTVPTVTITDPTGSGAAATAVLNSKGQITPYTVTNGGAGYTAAPVVTISAPNDPNGVQATAQAVIQNGQVVAILPLIGGSGYTTAPTITVAAPTGTVGTQAAATAIVPAGGSLVSFIVTQAGSNYSNPSFTLGPPAILAQATANLVNGQVASYTITNAGGGYATPPQVLLQANGADPYNLELDHAGFFSDRADFFPNGSGTEKVTAAVIGIGPFTNQRPVDVGTKTPGAYSLIQTDVTKFKSDALVVGGRKYLDPAYGAGVITVSQGISADILNLESLTLASAREIRDLGGTTGISFSNLVLDAGGAVSFSGSGNKIHYFSGVIRDSGLAPGASFEINSLLRTGDGNGIVPFTVGQVVVGAPEFSGKTFYQGITTQDGDIVVRADDIELTQVVGFLDTTGGGTIAESTSSVTLGPVAHGGTRPVNINYYGLSRPNGTLAGSSYFGLTSVQVENPGTGYTTVPTVTISGGGGSGATGVAQMVLGAINTAGGIGTRGQFSTQPTVTVSAPDLPGGLRATAEAIVDFRATTADGLTNPNFGKVIGTRITNQGRGYTTAPTVLFSDGTTTASTSSTLTVGSIYLTSLGSGYTTTPTIQISSPGGTSFTTATATGLLGALSLRINNPSQLELENIRAASVVIGGNSGGSNYLSSAGPITLNTDFGYNYALYPYAPRTLVLASDQSVALGLSQIPPSPWPQAATSSIKTPNFSVIAGGAVNLGQYGQASAVAQVQGGSVSQISVDYEGEGYTQAPTVTLSAPDQAGGTQATATAVIDSSTGRITGFTITNQGSGYAQAPQVSLTGPILTAQATAVMGLGDIAVTNGGSGYSANFPVTITGGGGTGATGTAIVRNGQVVRVSIDNPGTGYTGPATISFTQGSGTGAVAGSKLKIISLAPTSGGTGYVQAPIVSITGGGGSGAQASAVLGTGGVVSSFNLASGGNYYTSVPTVSLTGTPAAPAHNIDFISANLTSLDSLPHSFTFSKPTGSLTVTDLYSLGGATGITTAWSGTGLAGNISLTAPVLNLPIMAPRLNDYQAISPYIVNGDGQLVVNPLYDPAYTIYPTLHSGGNIYLSATGTISIAVAPTFDSAGWNTPPSGSTVNSAIQATSANSLIRITADRIEIGDSGSNLPPAGLIPPLIAANLLSGRVILQPSTAGTPIVLGAKGATDFNFTATELQNIQANVLQIGNSTAGPITVDTLISLSSARLTGALSLISGSSIQDNGPTSGIQYGGGLRLSANGVISFLSPLNDFGTVAAYSNGNNITLTSGAFSIAMPANPVDGLFGINASTITGSPLVASSRVILQPNAPVAITLGGASSPNPGWGFSTAELGYVNAGPTTGVLQIGRNDGGLASGNITIQDYLVLNPALVPTLSLWTGGGVLHNPGGTAGVAVSNLAIRAGASVNMGGVLNPLTGNTDTVNLVSSLAAELTGTGSLDFANSQALTIGQVDGLLGIVTAGGTADGVTLTADNLQVDQPISVGAGEILLQPLSQDTDIVLGGTANSLNLSQAEMALLVSTTMVTIGRFNGTGGISIGSAGTLDLSSQPYSLTLQGQASNVSFDQSATAGGGLILAAGRTFILRVGTGNVTTTVSPNGIVDVTIGDGTTGTLQIASAGSVGTASAPFTTKLAVLSGGALSGNLYLVNSGTSGLTVSGPVSVQNTIGILSLTASAGNLTTLATGTLSAGGAITGNGNSVSIGDTVSSRNGSILFRATTPGTGTFANTATLTSQWENGLNADGTQDPTITLEADNLTLGATVTAATGSGGILLEPLTASRDLYVFTSGPGFEVSNSSYSNLGPNAPVTIGRADGTGNVSVGGRTGITQNLAIRTPARTPSGTRTFTVSGSLQTTGSNLSLNSGGGYLYVAPGIGIDVGAGSVSLIGQKIEVDGTVTAGYLGSVYNGSSGGAYLNYGGPPAPTSDDLDLFGTGTINTGIFGFGANGVVYVGDTQVGATAVINGLTINSRGLSLQSNTQVALKGNITSSGDPLIVDGRLNLDADRTIRMGGGALSILQGIYSTTGTENLDLILGGGSLVLAGDESPLAGATQQIGLLDIQNPGSVQFGRPLAAGQPARGLFLNLSENFSLLTDVTLAGDRPIRVNGIGTASLTFGNLADGSGATAPLALSTQAGSLQVNSISATDVQLSTPRLTTGSTITATTGNARIFADQVILGGDVTALASGAEVQLGAFSSTGSLVLGGSQIPVAALQKLQAPAGKVVLGRAGGGAVTIAGPIDLSGSATSSYEILGSSLTFQGTLSLPTANGMLSLNLGEGDVVSSGGLDYSGNLLQITSAGNVNIGTAIPTFGSMAQSFRSLRMRNYGSLTINGSIVASGSGTGTVSIRTLSGNLTLAAPITAGMIQLGAAQNFINLAGSDPFTNLGGGRTLVYSAGQRYDIPYNFAGLSGFGVAFGQGFGSMPGGGNFLVYSQYAQTGLDDGVVYNEMFAGNSVSSLLALSPSLFWSVNGQMIPKTRAGGYIDYMLYPQRVEPATMTLPEPVLSRLEQKLGRPPTVAEIAADEAERRRNRMLRSGGIVERNSFDADPEPQVEPRKQIRADRVDAQPAMPSIPQAQATPAADVPTARAVLPGESAPQAGKSKDQNQEVKGPMLRRGMNRAVALRPEPLNPSKVLAEEREKAEVNLAAPVAAGK